MACSLLLLIPNMERPRALKGSAGAGVAVVADVVAVVADVAAVATVAGVGVGV